MARFVVAIQWLYGCDAKRLNKKFVTIHIL